jgi:hypothetical protein
MITAVYFEDIDGYKVVVAAFLMTYDAKVFIEADKSFKKLEMQELTLDAWAGLASNYRTDKQDRRTER